MSEVGYQPHDSQRDDTTEGRVETARTATPPRLWVVRNRGHT